jgi:hypothetical protein
MTEMEETPPEFDTVLGAVAKALELAGITGSPTAESTHPA